MTAHRERRRRRTIFGAVAAVVLLVIAAALVVVGASNVVNSTAGEEVVGETRPVVLMPNTDNAAVAVIDAEDRLTSLIIATLSPSGVGGSVVTIPVNADASIGFGDTRRPLDAAIDLADPNEFFETVEATLAISLQFGEIVTSERLTEIIAPVAPIEIEVATTVADSVAPPDDTVVDSVAPSEDPVEVDVQEMGVELIVQALRTHDETGASYDHHQIDVDIWSALAANTPVADAGAPPPTDEFDRPLPSTTIDELFGRLWRGPVQVRDVAVQSSTPTEGIDSVLIDRYDALLVFAQIAPGRVSTPNQGLVFRVEVPLSDAQLEPTAEVVGTRSEIAHELITQLLFLAANVVSVDTTAASEGAGGVNRIEVADELFIDDMETLIPSIFGESEVVVAQNLVDGVDVVLRLGTAYIDLKESQADSDSTAEPETESTEPAAEQTADGDTVDADG